jgi:WD40 repeat protein
MAPTACPKCGKPLPAGAPVGPCPSCLQRLTPNGTGAQPAEAALTVDAPFAPAGASTLAVSGRPSAAAAGVAGRTFGDYQLLGEVARGGMGVVYRARQVSLGRTVALKMILAGQLASADDVRRFQVEAEAAANLDHPHIVPIYEVGEHDGQHYFSMKLVEGGSLAQAVRGGRWPAQGRDGQRQAAALVETVARAVHFAHQRGILHRDLKPGNILLEWRAEHGGEPVPYVTDFGLAKRVEGGQQATGSAVVGTPGYMAPEQAQGRQPLTTAADVYALGAILFELLTGRPPFRADTPLATVLQVIQQEPPRPRAVNPRADRDLETVCLKCLDKEPARRYGSAEALADDLGRWLRGEPIQARPAGSLERAWKWARRRPALAALGLTVLLAAAALLGLGVFYNARLQLALDEVEQQKEAVRKVQGEADQQLAAARALQRQVAYAADLSWAQRELREAWPGRATDLLDKHLGSDLVGWEWYYLQRQCHPELLALPGSRWVVWSPDGRLLATNWHKAITVRDAATGKLIRTFPSDAVPEGCVAFDRVGRHLAAAAFGGFAVWDVRTGKKVADGNVPGDAGRPYFPSLALRPDGRQLALAGPWAGVALAEVATGKRKADLTYAVDKSRPRDEHVLRVGYTAGGKVVAAVTGAGRVVLWDSDSGRPRGGFNPVQRGTSVEAVALGTNLETFASLGAGLDLHFARLDPDGQVREERGFYMGHEYGRQRVLAVSPAGTHLLSAAWGERVIRAWDLLPEPAAAWRGHDAEIVALAFRPDGKRFASLSADNVLKVWDAAGAGPRAAAPAAAVAELSDFAFSTDGKLLALGRAGRTLPPAAAADEAVVELYDARSRRPLGVLDRSVRVPTKEAVTLLKRVAFSPDGKRLAAVDVLETPASAGVPAGPVPTVRVWDVATRRPAFSLQQAGEFVAFSPDGRWLATLARAGPGRAGKGDTIRLWDAATGNLTDSREGAGTHGCCPAFSHDSTLLALGGDTITLLAVTGDGLRPLHTFPEPARCLAFSPAGRFLATSSARGAVMVWDVDRKKLHQFILQQPARDDEPPAMSLLARTPRWLAFTPDGKRLAYATDYHTVRLWDVKAEQDAVELPPSAARVDRLAFSPGGHKLFAVSSGGKDASFLPGGAWHVWDATPLPEDVLYARVARRKIDELTQVVGLKDEVGARLRRDRDLSEPARRVALRRLEDFEEDPGRLNDLAWEVVAAPDASPRASLRGLALRQAQRAAELAPQDEHVVNTLGVALYRASRYREALQTLRKAHQMVAEKDRSHDYWNLAFLAMAYQHLGDSGKARAYLKALRAVPAAPQAPGNEAEFQAFLREAEGLIEGKKQAPVP